MSPLAMAMLDTAPAAGRGLQKDSCWSDTAEPLSPSLLASFNNSAAADHASSMSDYQLVSQDDVRQLLGLPADEAAAPPQQLRNDSGDTQTGAGHSPETMTQQHRYGSRHAHEDALHAAPGHGQRGAKLKPAKNAQQRYRERQKTRLQDSEQKVAELTAELRTLRMQKESMAMRNRLLEKMLPGQHQDGLPAAPSVVLGADSAWWLDPHTKRLLEDLIGLGSTVTFTVGPGPPLTLPREQVEDMPQPQYTALWEQYISAFADLLLKAPRDASPESPTAQRLAQLVVEGWQLHAAIGLKHPDHHIRHKPHLAVGRDGTSLLAAITLTKGQKKALLGLRRLYLLNLGALLARRERLTATVQSSAGVELDNLHMLVQITNELANTLRAEHSLFYQLMASSWRQVLTPVQAATLQLHAHPGKAEMLQLIEFLAEGAGEPTAAALTAEGAETKPEALPPFDGALALLRQYAAPGGGLIGDPCEGHTEAGCPG